MNQLKIAMQYSLPTSTPKGDRICVKNCNKNLSAGAKSITEQGVMATGASFEQVENILNQMLKSGYVGIDNDRKTGVVIYDFYELS